MSGRIDLSIVIPIYNEDETINELWNRLSSVLRQLDEKAEVIFVNDGSRDQSLFMLTSLSQQHGEIRVISLSRNFGHQCALTAGIDNASGRAVVLMDGDLQGQKQFCSLWQPGSKAIASCMPSDKSEKRA